MKDVGKKFGTAKLFAKHMKIETQIEILKKDIFLAAGTPARCISHWDFPYCLFAMAEEFCVESAEWRDLFHWVIWGLAT